MKQFNARGRREIMPVNDELGKRMKTFYEQIPKIKLMRRTPVIIRIDGKAFHTFTKGFERPFDEILIKTMQETTKYLCENIQGCVLGYTQSDEISLVLVDYQRLESAAWFDYEIQKMCSIAASMATLAFNKIYKEHVDEVYKEASFELALDREGKFVRQEDYLKADEALEKKYDVYYDRINKAMFDARVFNIPKEEVTNCLYWRQLDAARNSVQMVGQANFSHKELQCKTCSNIRDMLMEQKGINWNDFPTYQKRGACVIKEEYVFEAGKKEKNGEGTTKEVRTHWIIDKEIPLFKGEGRQYIEKLVMVGE